MKTTFVISSLGPGGAERMVGRLAGHRARRGEVSLLTFDDGRQAPFYPLPAGVRHRPLDLARRASSVGQGLWNNLHRIRGLRRALRQESPDAIVSFVDQTNVVTLIAAEGSGIPVLVSERIDPGHYRLPAIWETLRRRVYPRAARIVVQTERAREFFGGSLRDRITVIPNPVARPTAPPLPAREGARLRLLAMGRLTPQKGFDLLIDAFAGIAGDCPSWDLTIHGEGPEADRLAAQVDRHRLGDRVQLAGLTPDAGAAMRRADLFCLSSRFEGFPNVLCEALAHGLPAVSFDCPSGPAEILRDGTDGILVPPEDRSALSAALREIMLDATRRARLAAEAPKILDRLGEETVMALWDRVVEAMVAGEPA